MNKYEGFVGKVLDGRYKILELVGLGGMACVLKAQDIVMNRIVAIKILNDEYTGNEAAEARFIDESKAVAMLSNKNIVSVYDVAIYPDIKYIVMEYLDGITMREYLDNKGVLGWKEACIYILQILRALEHAHSKGIIHRDIKPQNVILMKNGDIKVTDFGIAKLPNSVSEQKDEKAVGTVYYISPEQACGKETDYYSDIYSVGIMFYETVTGTLPFTAETPMEVAMMQVNDEPVHPRDIVLDIPVGVAQIILKAMEKSPSDRFQSAHTMVKAIEWVLRYPDVIFNMSDSSADENTLGNSSVVSIDMISTAEIEPYGDEEIADSLGKKKGTKSGSKAEKGEKAAEKKPKKIKKHKSNKTMFPIISGVSLAFIIVALMLLIPFAVNTFTNFTTPSEEVEAKFPDLTQTYYSDDLENKLLDGSYGAKFAIDKIITVSYDDIENNKIISTEPNGGHLGKADDDGKFHFTQIVVNKTEKAIIPTVSFYPKTTAEAMLSQLGLEVEYEYVSTSDNIYISEEQVIDTEPPAGTEVNVGDTIILRIFKRDTVTMTAAMPDVIGMTKEEATRFVRDYALYEVEFIETPVAGGDNRVIEQSIEPGKISAKGTKVTITIAIPLQTFTMPNLMGLTYDEARLALDNASPDRVVNFSTLYFELDQSVKPYFETESSAITDYNEFQKLIMEFDAQQVFTNDGIGTVVYQGIAPETDVPKETSTINIIIVTYTTRVVDIPGEPSESEPSGPIVPETSGGDNTGDESVGDVSSDTSGDESSGGSIFDRLPFSANSNSTSSEN